MNRSHDVYDAEIRALNDELVHLRYLLGRARGRIRHDHAYPFEINPDHHCPGCDVEKAIDRAVQS